MALMAGGVGAGTAKLRGMAARDPAFAVGGETWEWGGAARHCPEAHGELARLGRLARGRSLFDPALAGDVREAYLASPWVREVLEVRREFPNRLAVDFRLRQPVAQAWQARRFWLVDEEGVALPAPEGGQAWPAPGLPEIVEGTPGALGDRPSRPGEAWNARGLRDALGLLMAVWSSPLADAVSPARVTVYAGTYRDRSGTERERPPRLEFNTADGRTVRWGTFNASGRPEELSTGHKLRTLETALRRAAGQPALAIDVHARAAGLSD